MARTKGHWPAGKRRNSPGAEWGRTLYRLRRRLKKTVYGKISAARLAAYIGVSERTVRRWLAGEDHPSEQAARQVADWLDSV